MGTLLQDSLRCRLCCEETAAGQDAFTARLEVPEGAGDLLATAAADHRARVLDTADGRLRHRFAGHPDWVTRVSFAPDGDRLFTISYDGSARVFPVGQPRRDEYHLGLNRRIASVEWWTLDESRLLIGCRDDTVRLLSITAKGSQSRRLMDYEDLRCARMLPGGHLYLAMSSSRTWLRCGDLDGGTRWTTRNRRVTDAYASNARDLMAVTPDGEFILAAAGGGVPRLVRASDGVVLHELRERAGRGRIVIAARPVQSEFVIWSDKSLPVL